MAQMAGAAGNFWTNLIQTLREKMRFVPALGRTPPLKKGLKKKPVSGFIHECQTKTEADTHSAYDRQWQPMYDNNKVIF
jgi:hypothetical protein